MVKELAFDEVFDAQQQFRIMLDCMARPGKISALKPFGFNPPAGINHGSVSVALSLLNGDVCFWADGIAVQEYLAFNTGSFVAPLKIADFIFMNGMDEAVDISEAKQGTLPYPEEGTTLVVDVDALNENEIPGAIKIVLKGPGINGENAAYITGISSTLLEQIKEQNTEFPLGVDVILTDKSNRIMAVPRSNQFDFQHI